ncbi:MAG: T9SS type A sorting domain-containing protein [Bacteroidota bacterium]
MKKLLLLAIIFYGPISWSQDALTCEDENTIKVKVKPGYNDPTGDGDADFRGWKHISDASSARDAKKKFKERLEEDIKDGNADYLVTTDDNALRCPEVCPDPSEVGCKTTKVEFKSGDLKAVAGDNDGYNVKQKDDDFRVEVTCGPCSPVTGGGNLQAMFPNPVNNMLSFQIEILPPQDLLVSVEIFDMGGIEVLEQNYGLQPIGMHVLDLDVSNLPPGLYFAQMYFDNIPSAPEEFIKM